MKCADLENETKVINLISTHLQTIANHLQTTEDSVKVSISGFRKELDEAKKIITPSKTDFFNLNRQIETLNQRLSLLESEPIRHERGNPLRVLMNNPLRPLITGFFIIVVGTLLLLLLMSVN